MESARTPLTAWLLVGLAAALLALGMFWARTRLPGAMPAAAQVRGEVVLTAAPRPEAYLEQPFVVRWTEGGQPVTGASVSIDLSMPDMAMPLNRFEARAVPGTPGLYRGTGTFTMSGKWLIWIAARSSRGGADHRQLIQVH